MEKKLKSDERQGRVHSAFYCLDVSRSRLLSLLRCYYLQLLLRVCVCIAGQMCLKDAQSVGKESLNACASVFACLCAPN